MNEAISNSMEEEIKDGLLLFGGTTEGRMAIAALEEAGSTYYYSTKTGEQDVTLHHGIAVSGAMDADAMRRFCIDHDIRLVVDAAHPFASNLHQTVAQVSQALNIPAIRYERLYPDIDADITWIDTYSQLPQCLPPAAVVLATTGVQSIAKLKPLEQHGYTFIYRILPRQSSIDLAHAQGAADSQLCYYHEASDEAATLQRLRPDVVLMKESGVTGGFKEKVEAAVRLGIKVVALRKPATPTYFHQVNGQHGLRLMVEKLMPQFYPLHSGLTTGTCATAAAVAHATYITSGRKPTHVPVVLPDGETIHVDVGYGQGYAYVVKPSGDDPDVTNGIEIRATVSAVASRFTIIGGHGVGRITLPGFDYPPGEAAINRVPRQMIEQNVTPLISPAEVVITVPHGDEIARRTFNPRLGIEGGISIIGISGIVKPFSEEAFVESIRKCMVVAKSSGADRVVINSGAKSEQYLRNHYPQLPPQAFVQYGNYIGETLRIADQLDINRLTLGIMLGKAVKLAAGQLDTHSRKAVMDRAFVRSLLLETGLDADIVNQASAVALARELWDILPPHRLQQFATTVIDHCTIHTKPLLPHTELTILLIDEQGHIWQ